MNPQPATEPIIWLRGQRVGLGSLRADLVPTYWAWENDPTTLHGYGRQVPDSLENRTEGYGHQTRNTLNQLRFTIYQLGEHEHEPAGLSTLLIDHQVRTAEYLILLAPHARGHGLATEATQLTLDYGFRITALRMIWLKVLEPNTAGIRAYTNAGFKPAGRLRQAGYWHGQPCDELILDTLHDEHPRPAP